MGAGVVAVTNAGTITGDVDLGEVADRITVSGLIEGTIPVGTGDELAG